MNNITTPEQFSKASFLERKYFLEKHDYSLTRLSKVFQCSVSTISRSLNNEKKLRKKLLAISHSKTLQKLYQKEKEQTEVNLPAQALEYNYE